MRIKSTDLALAKVISGFPGIGKSTLVRAKPTWNISDSDSSTFDKSEFPQNYIQHIQQSLGTRDWIMVSSHQEVRDAMCEAGIPFLLVYPERGLKSEYMQRYRDRGSPQQFLDLMNNKWDDFITGCLNQVGCEHYVLQSGQYLIDAPVFNSARTLRGLR